MFLLFVIFYIYFVLLGVLFCLLRSFFFFFSSISRHTRCALVTGVQTCALPISGGSRMSTPHADMSAASDARRNWTALYTVARREVVRILRIWGQTLVPPAITMTLYFLIFGGLIGSRVGEKIGRAHV